MAKADLLERIWHHLPVKEVVDFLETDPDHGLAPEEAQRRREIYGANVLTQRPGKSALMRFLLQFHAPLIYILIVSGAVTALLGEWVDSSVIFGVVLVNAIIGYIQEARAESAILALARILTTDCTVVRGGVKKSIPSSELTLGDLVLVNPGDKVPADLRLLRVKELSVDESALTGESLPVSKGIAPLAHDLSLADRTNMAYAGTLAVRGQAAGLVVAVGDRTETGRISRLMEETVSLATPLTRKIEGFSRFLLWLILALAALTFAVGIWRGESAFDMFMAAVALSVGAIPEGLPAAVTITLAIGVARMARRGAIIRHLPAVETLGSATVICSDKTGTLTQNRMAVQEILAGGDWFFVTGAGDSLEGAIEPFNAADHAALGRTLAAAVLCNDGHLDLDNESLQLVGDPTETALLVAGRKGGIDHLALARSHPRRDELPFDSASQYMATLHGAGGDSRIFAKGAVERVLVRCDQALAADGSLGALDAEAVEEAALAMAAKGLRVLALAEKPEEVLNNLTLEGGFTFLGLVGMIDPPRPEARHAVRACHSAGVDVKMITGDHAVTAAAIAEAVGIAAAGKVQLLTGRELGHLDNEELENAVSKTHVFARVEPEQKLRLVRALQAKGHVVAMTGDGVNDAPALKQADIGVAMGIGGTEVAKEAADMVLTDDNFATIEAAVEEGRGVFDNLTKFIVWTLPTNFGEGLVITAAVLLGVALPILPVQILWINMTTAVLLGLTLAFEPIEKGIMRRKPRRPDAPILGGELIGRIFLVAILLLAGSFGLFMWELERGAPVDYARTVAANVFVMGELFYLFNCRSMSRPMWSMGLFSNWWLIAGVALMIVLQGLFTYAPAMNEWFRTTPIDLAAWGRITAVGLAIYVTIGVEKWLKYRQR